MEKTLATAEAVPRVFSILQIPSPLLSSIEFNTTLMRRNQPIPSVTIQYYQYYIILPILLNTITFIEHNLRGTKKPARRSGGPLSGPAARRPASAQDAGRSGLGRCSVTCCSLCWGQYRCQYYSESPQRELGATAAARVNLARGAPAGPWRPGRLISTSS